MEDQEELNQRLSRILRERRDQNAFRILSSPSGLIDFCSNDYLGNAKFHSAIELNGASGSTGSRLISGNSHEAEQFEKFLGTFFHTEKALLFNSGYSANIGLISCLATRGDTVIYDSLVHASIRDGIRLSHAQSFSFRHNDTADLEKKLSHAKGQIFILVESVYSMDGDFSPLKEITALAKKYKANVIVDEAHSVGVFGEEGRGLVDEWQLNDSVFARVITFGKAIGSHGAAVIGSSVLIDYLINFSRSFIYTTALPPADIMLVQQSFKNAITKDAERKKLFKLIRLFCYLAGAEFKSLLPSSSPIQCILIPGNSQARDVAATIQKAGWDVRPILSPTVPEGSERIRICLHAFNTEEQIQQLLAVLKSAMK